MKEHPISKSQERALRVLSLGTADTYPAARALLSAQDFAEDGLPTGHTWRSAAKLTDDELVAARSSTRDTYRADEGTETLWQAYGGHPIE